MILFFYYSLGNNCDDSSDFYKLLSVPRDATVQEIRKAFKVLAVKLHPDKNKVINIILQNCTSAPNLFIRKMQMRNKNS